MSQGYRAVETGMAEVFNMLQFDRELEGMPALSERELTHLRRLASRIISYTVEHCARIVEEAPYDNPDIDQGWPAIVGREFAVDTLTKAIRESNGPYEHMGIRKVESIGEQMGTL